MSSRRNRASVCVRVALVAVCFDGSGTGTSRATAVADPAREVVGTIEGWVTREGRPERARVEVRRLFDLDAHLLGSSTLEILDRLVSGPKAWEPVASVSTDDAGHYEVKGLEPAVYDATAIASDEASDWTGVTIPVPGARVEASMLVSAAPRSAHGTAVLSDGTPFRGQLLWSPSWTRGEYENCAMRARSAVLAVDGRFTLKGIGDDDYDLIALVPGRLRVRAPLQPTAGEEVGFVVDDGFVDVRVRVLGAADGKPIEGVALFASGDTPSGGAALVRGSTDAEGRCALRAIVGTKSSITALKLGYAETWIDSIVPIDREIEIRIPRAARLSGRVVSAGGGGGVAGLVVRAIHAESPDEWLAGRAVTDADGHYVIDDIQPGPVVVVAEGRGMSTQSDDGAVASATSRSVSLEPGKAAVVDFDVHPTFTRRGRLLDADGRAVGGAVVRVVGHERARGWKCFDEDSRVREVTATAADGTFSVGRGGQLDIRVPGHAQNLIDPPEGKEAAFTVRLPRVRRVEVLVLDDVTGEPMAGAAVEVRCWTREASTKWRGITGLDGRAVSSPTIYGAYSVAAAVRGYAASGIGIATEAEVPEKATIRLVRGVSLSGRAVLADRKTPAAGATIVCSIKLPGGYAANAEAVAGPDGSFQFSDLPPAPVLLELLGQLRGSARFSDSVLKIVGGRTDVLFVIE